MSEDVERDPKSMSRPILSLVAEGLRAPQLVEPLARCSSRGCVRVTVLRCLELLDRTLRGCTPRPPPQDLASMFAEQPPVHFQVHSVIAVSEVQKPSEEVCQSFGTAVRPQGEVRQVPVEATARSRQPVPTLQET